MMTMPIPACSCEPIHTLITGRTGMGKSTLLAGICSEKTSAGSGFLLVDPHGDLAVSVLATVPRRRRNDLVWFDATEPAACRGLNPLRQVPPERRALVDETHRRWVLKQVTDSHVLKEKSRHPEWDDGSEESRRTSRVGYGLSST